MGEVSANQKPGKLISELTYKVIAFPAIKLVNNDEFIDWAIEMVELGYETRSLLILAGFSYPLDFFEAVPYIKSSIKELGLEPRTGENATISYASYYARKIARKDSIRKNLGELYDFYNLQYSETPMNTFWHLYWAWDTIDFKTGGHNPHWPGADQSNIEQIVIVEAKKWLNENEPYYRLPEL